MNRAHHQVQQLPKINGHFWNDHLLRTNFTMLEDLWKRCNFMIPTTISQGGYIWQGMWQKRLFGNFNWMRCVLFSFSFEFPTLEVPCSELKKVAIQIIFPFLYPECSNYLLQQCNLSNPRRLCFFSWYYSVCSVPSFCDIEISTPLVVYP